MLSPHDCSVNSSVLLSSGLPLPPQGSICGATSPPVQGSPAPGSWPLEAGNSLRMWVGSPGAAHPPAPTTAGQRPQCGAAGVLSRPRPMTGRLRMPPIIQLTEHKGPTQGAASPAPGSQVHGGSEVPTQKGRAVPRAGEGVSHTGREPFPLASWETKDRQKRAGELVTGGEPLRSLTPDLEVCTPLPPPPPGHPSRGRNAPEP